MNKRNFLGDRKTPARKKQIKKGLSNLDSPLH